MKRRRAIMVEAELADMVKDVAARYGMTVASYVRALLRSAMESERHGIFAPRAVSRYVVLRLMSRMGVTPLPVALLSARSAEEARMYGRRVGAALKGLEVDAFEALALVAEGLPGAIVERDKLILVFGGEPWSELLKSFITGLAEALGLQMDERGPTLIIRIG